MGAKKKNNIRRELPIMHANKIDKVKKDIINYGKNKNNKLKK